MTDEERLAARLSYFAEHEAATSPDIQHLLGEAANALAARDAEIERLREAVALHLENKWSAIELSLADAEATKLWMDLHGIKSLDALKAERDAALAQRDGWMESAAQFHGNEQFYCSIVTQIGEPFGVAARTSDDGSVQENVLALKVPELVSSLRAERDAAVAALREIDHLRYSSGTDHLERALEIASATLNNRKTETP